MIEIQNRIGKLKLNDGVHKESADKLIEELDRLYGPAAVLAKMKIGEVVCAADDALESVEIEINSPGGSVFEGQRIYNALRGMSARGVPITTTVSGVAASMGSVIMMAGDTRRMNQGSRIMIHDASTYAFGNAQQLRKSAELLEGISTELADIYADRTGTDAAYIRKMMLAETWMDVNVAKANGFIHAIIKDGKETAELAPVDIRAEKPISIGMSLLAKLFPGNDEVSKLEASILENDSLRAELIEAQARITELTGITEINIGLQSEITALTAQLSDANTALETAATDLATANEAIAAAKESAGAEAVQILATIGQPDPLAINEDAAAHVNEISLTAFNAKTPHEKMQFVKSGGKLKI